MPSFFQLPSNTLAQVGDVTVLLKRLQRFSSSPAEATILSFSNEVIRAEWRWNRMGGLGSAEIELGISNIYQDSTGLSNLSFPANLSEWNSSRYLGGIVEIWVRTRSAHSSVITDNISTRVYMGRVDSIDLEPDHGTAKIACSSIGQVLEDLTDKQTFTQQSIRSIITTLVDQLIRSTTIDFQLKGRNITVPTGAIDNYIPLYEKDGTHADAIKFLMSLLPSRLVWGVDANGIFYVQPQNEVYWVDGTVSFVNGYSLQGDGVTKYTRTLDQSDSVSAYVVEGQFDDDTDTRVSSGYAVNPRAQLMFGARVGRTFDNSIPTPSLAVKYAQARLRDRGVGTLKAELTVSELIDGNKSFYNQLTLGSAPIYINERGATSRTMGEYTGSSLELDGRDTPTGRAEYATWPSRAVYEVANDFLFQLAINFLAGPTSAGTYFVFGKPDSAVGIYGFSCITWDQATGKLHHRYTGSDSVQYTNDTGITVNPGGSFPVKVPITVRRTSGGSWNYYNGTVNTNSVGGQPNPKIGAGFSDQVWRVARNNSQPAWKGTKIAVNEFRFFKTVSLKSMFSNTGVDQFIIANNRRRLKSNWRANGDFVAWCEFVEGNGNTFRVKVSDETVDTVTVFYNGSTTPGTVVIDLYNRWGRSWYDGQPWGGPLILSPDSVKYTVHAMSGIVETVFSLGSKDLDFATSIAKIQQDVTDSRELLRRTKQDV